jgi:hypothetical protein
MMAQNEQRAKRPLTMPVLRIGRKTSHAVEVGQAMKSLADNVQTAVIPGAGHRFAEEAPEATVAALTAFLAPNRDGSATAHNLGVGSAGGNCRPGDGIEASTEALGSRIRHISSPAEEDMLRGLVRLCGRN